MRWAWVASVASLCVGLAGSVGCSADARDVEKSPSSGGSAADGTGGSAGSAGSGGGGTAGTLLSAEQCPEQEPSGGDACDVDWLDCVYETCGDGTRSWYKCSEGVWQVKRSCDATCPEERPEAFGECTGYEGLECHYDEDSCGTVQSVGAQCQNATWYLYGPSRGEGSTVCDVHHLDGDPCELPDGCSRASCYSISCYGQPLVEDCIDGVWRVRTSCSK